MRILVTGGAGYIGAHLVRQLIERGHDVVVLDALHWGGEPIAGLGATIIQGDIRDWQDEWLTGIDAVCHLAGLSNDPTAEFDPELNLAVNFVGTEKIVASCMKARIRRFTFASSASIYDTGSTNSWPRPAREADLVTPIGAYSETKYMGECAVLNASDEHRFFKPVVLRQATVYGDSPRMRFDLVINAMVRDGLSNGSIQVHGTGDMWRPMISVERCAQAHVLAIEADPERVGGRIYNAMDWNFTVLRMAEMVKHELVTAGHPCVLTHVPMPEGRRSRNYRMDSTRFDSTFGWLDANTTAIRAMVYAWEAVSKADRYKPEYQNIDWMKLRAAVV